MDLSNLTEEQIKRASECESSEELMALVEAEDIDLTDEQLEAVAGGSSWWQEINDED